MEERLPFFPLPSSGKEALARAACVLVYYGSDTGASLGFLPNRWVSPLTGVTAAWKDFAMLAGDDRFPLDVIGRLEGADALAALKRARERLETRGRILRGSSLDPVMVRESLRCFDLCVASLLDGLDLDPEPAFLVRQSALQACFPVLVLCQQGELRAAWSLFFGLFRQIAEAFGASLPLSWSAEVAEPAFVYLALDSAEARRRSRSALLSFQAALREHMLLGDLQSRVTQRQPLSRVPPAA